MQAVIVGVLQDAATAATAAGETHRGVDGTPGGGPYMVLSLRVDEVEGRVNHSPRAPVRSPQLSSAPPQLLPAPAVQPKQWPPTAIGACSSASGCSSRMCR